jgi:hypothetical protein
VPRFYKFCGLISSGPGPDGRVATFFEARRDASEVLELEEELDDVSAADRLPDRRFFGHACRAELGYSPHAGGIGQVDEGAGVAATIGDHLDRGGGESVSPWSDCGCGKMIAIVNWFTCVGRDICLAPSLSGAQ